MVVARVVAIIVHHPAPRRPFPFPTLLQLVPCFKVGNKSGPRRSDSSNLDSSNGRDEHAYPHRYPRLWARAGMDIFSLWIFDRNDHYREVRKQRKRPCQQRKSQKSYDRGPSLFLTTDLLRTAASVVYSWTALKTSHASASFCRPGPRTRRSSISGRTYTFIRTGRVSHRGGIPVVWYPSLSRASFPLRPN